MLAAMGKYRRIRPGTPIPPLDESLTQNRPAMVFIDKNILPLTGNLMKSKAA
jgi:hypothetical protein